MKHTYARVNDNIVEDIVIHGIVQDFIGETNWIDVSHVRPVPQIGWKYHPENRTFRPYLEQHIILETAREEARRAVDIAAGNSRARHITIIPGQQEVYREKFDEAIDYMTNYGRSKVNDDDFPLLLVETAIRDVSMLEIAQEIVFSKKQWVKKMASIEALRLGGKYDVNKCTTVTEINRLKGQYIHKLNLI